MRQLAICLVLLCLFATVPALAQSWSTNPNSTDGLPVNPQGGGGACGPDTITHSVSQAITPGNSVSCNNGLGHADNSYFRSFVLADFGYPDGFEVCSVDVAIESASGPDQPMTVNLFTEDMQPFPGATRTQIGTATTSVVAQATSLLTVPVAGTAPAGSELVVEVFTPNGQTVGNFFFIGSNAGGETAPSYLQAADCGVTTPTPTGAIGFAGMNIVLNVTGTPIDATPILEVPTAGFWGLIGLFALLASAGVLFIRRS